MSVKVWAIEHTGDEPELRWSGIDLDQGLALGLKIARATTLSKTRGAVSVWVEDSGTTVWTAGAKVSQMNLAQFGQGRLSSEGSE